MPRHQIAIGLDLSKQPSPEEIERGESCRRHVCEKGSDRHQAIFDLMLWPPYFEAAIRIIVPGNCEAARSHEHRWRGVPIVNKTIADGPQHQKLWSHLLIGLCYWLRELEFSRLQFCLAP